MTYDLAPAPGQSTAGGVGMATNKGPPFSRRAETHHHGDTHTYTLARARAHTHPHTPLSLSPFLTLAHPLLRLIICKSFTFGPVAVFVLCVLKTVSVFGPCHV